MIKEYPDFMLLTDDMLQTYITKSFIKECPFNMKKPWITSYYADLTQKRCVMGDNVDCTTCSCAVPAGAYVLKHHLTNLDNFRKIQRILF